MKATTEVHPVIPVLLKLQELKVGTTAFLVLEHLSRRGETTPTPLALEVGCSTATMTDIVDVLEESKFVERARDEKDRRKINIKLRTTGQLLVELILQS